LRPLVSLQAALAQVLLEWILAFVVVRFNQDERSLLCLTLDSALLTGVVFGRLEPLFVFPATEVPSELGVDLQKLVA
jgi:hypothetical protein